MLPVVEYLENINRRRSLATISVPRPGPRPAVAAIKLLVIRYGLIAGNH